MLVKLMSSIKSSQVSRCMSTQHPDNISSPFFADGEVIQSDAEVKEAFYVFSQLGCKEQMWDSEGKEADNQVVEKLLSRYTEFFSKNLIGRDLFLTYRVPNPAIQKEQGKILLETLHSIPRAFDVAQSVNNGIAPIFEIILPMTTSAEELERIRDYYSRVMVGQRDTLIGKMNKQGHGGVAVKDWIGDFKPDEINVIPLFETSEALMGCADIVEEYLHGKEKKLEYQRVFLARSDPALNYGAASAVLMAKCALFDLQELEERINVELLPILGVGGAPFRGNFRPDNVSNCGDEYPSVQTFTAQSSFKYDHHPRDVINAVDILNHSKRSEALSIDRGTSLNYIEKMKTHYQKEISHLADIINALASHIPARRSRKLHIGLFGYSRSLKGMRLPRAINFCAALYSIGLPPEFLGLGGLTEKELDGLREIYVKLDEDLRDAGKFFSRKAFNELPHEIQKSVAPVIDRIIEDCETDPDYESLAYRTIINIKGGHTVTLTEDVKRMAWMRKFLG